jgi:hypothetical protein
MKDIELNIVNQSEETNSLDVVIFQKNEAASPDELAVAWRVIHNLGRADSHPFTFSPYLSIGASDSYGNYTPQLVAQEGQQFSMVSSSSGDVLQFSGQSDSPGKIELVNALKQGAIGAHIYRDRLLLALKTNIAPGQKAAFAFDPVIWIGVASQVEEGEVLNSAAMSEINTEISLMGIAGADIVITGGGSGSGSTQLMFTLTNVHYI